MCSCDYDNQRILTDPSADYVYLDLSLAQIFPMTDEVTGAEPKIISASFADPYVLLVRDDASVMVLKADESGDLDEVERGDDLLTTKWLSGSLYEDADDIFRLAPDDETEEDIVNVLMFLLSAEGGLYVRNHHAGFTIES